MNYRHHYHAGSFVDTFKHITLMAVLKELCKKPNALCFLDTHAGRGFYDLNATPSQKSKEYLSGIDKVLNAPNKPELVEDYLAVIKSLQDKMNSANSFYYPGSTWFAKATLRPQDKIIACELQAEEFQALKFNLKAEKQIAVHHMDGYQSLNALLPPAEKRGLILIDPPYEKIDEFTTIISALRTALNKWQSGVFAIWYPIKESMHERFKKELKKHFSQEILAVELSPYEARPNLLSGSGLAIINPPWQLAQSIDNFLPWLNDVLAINKLSKARQYLLK